MPTIIATSLLLITVAIPVGLTRAQAEPDVSHAKRADRIESQLLPVFYLEGQASPTSIPERMSRDGVPGLGMAFIAEGKVAWTRYYGLEDAGETRPVTSRTVFAGASLSKPIAAMAALQLVEAGLLRLDDDVNDSLVGWKIPEDHWTQEEKVTLRRLIGHRAGIRNDLWSAYNPGSRLPSLVAMLSGQAPSVDPPVAVEFVPGSRRQYSNPGYAIIQKLIEDVTGHPFDVAIRNQIFDPVGMPDSSFRQPIPERLMERKAVGHDSDQTPYAYQAFPFQAAGGIWTTPDDLARFIGTLLDDYHNHTNTLLSRETLATVFSRQPDRLGFSKIYGDDDDDVIFRHWGSNAGFTCYLVGNVNQQQGLVVMTNSDLGFELMDHIGRAVAREYDWDHLQPTVCQPTDWQSIEADRYQGRFDWEDGVLVFDSESGRLFLRRDDDSSDSKRRPLVPVGQDAFVQVDGTFHYRFLRSDFGKIEWVRVTHANGNNSDYQRLPDTW